MQVILHTLLLKATPGRGIQSCPLTTVSHINLIHIAHQFQCLRLADILKQRTAKVVGDIVLAVRKRTGAAKSAHDGTGITPDTTLDLLSVDGTFPPAQFVSRLEQRNLQLRLQPGQLVGRKNPAGSCSDDNHIIFHTHPPLHRPKEKDQTIRSL